MCAHVQCHEWTATLHMTFHIIKKDYTPVFGMNRYTAQHYYMGFSHIVDILVFLETRRARPEAYMTVWLLFPGTQ